MRVVVSRGMVSALGAMLLFFALATFGVGLRTGDRISGIVFVALMLPMLAVLASDLLPTLTLRIDGDRLTYRDRLARIREVPLAELRRVDEVRRGFYVWSLSRKIVLTRGLIANEAEVVAYVREAIARNERSCPRPSRARVRVARAAMHLLLVAIGAWTLSLQLVRSHLYELLWLQMILGLLLAALLAGFLPEPLDTVTVRVEGDRVCFRSRFLQSQALRLDRISRVVVRDRSARIWFGDRVLYLLHGWLDNEADLLVYLAQHARER